MVDHLRKSGRNERLIESPLQRGQLRFAIARDRQWPIAPMMHTDPVRVALELLIDRRNLVPRPLRMPEPFPDREISRAAPLKGSRIHRRRATNDLPPHKADTAAFDRCSG